MSSYDIDEPAHATAGAAKHPAEPWKWNRGRAPRVRGGRPCASCARAQCGASGVPHDSVTLDGASPPPHRDRVTASSGLPPPI